jgi:hypothetical protein
MMPLIMKPAKTAANVAFADAEATADQTVTEQPTPITPVCRPGRPMSGDRLTYVAQPALSCAENGYRTNPSVIKYIITTISYHDFQGTDCKGHTTQSGSYGAKRETPAAALVIPIKGSHPLFREAEVPSGSEPACLAEGGSKQKAAAMTQQVARLFEAGIRAHPQDWHMLQKVFVADLDPARLAAAAGAAGAGRSEGRS